MPALRTGKPAAHRRFFLRFFVTPATDFDVRGSFVPGGNDLGRGHCDGTFPGKKARTISWVLLLPGVFRCASEDVARYFA